MVQDKVHMSIGDGGNKFRLWGYVGKISFNN